MKELKLSVFFFIIITSQATRAFQSSSRRGSLTASSLGDTSDASPHDTSFSSSDDDSLSENTQYNYKPTELTVVRLSNSSVVLRWEFPPDVPENLQFFKVQYKRTAKGQDWITDNREIHPFLRAYQLNGLKPGNYNFAVLAVIEDDNISSDSIKFRLRAQSKIAPEELPTQEAPTIYWSETEHDYFRFKWRYKVKEKDMPNFGYLVYYRSSHQVSDFYIHNTMDENVEIADVEPDTPYEAKVVAYNDVGVSEFSRIISIKTKMKPNETTVSGSTTPIPSTNMNHESITSTPSTTTSTTERLPTDVIDRYPQKPSEEKPVLITPPQVNDRHYPKAPTTSSTTQKPAVSSKENTDNNGGSKDSVTNSIFNSFPPLTDFLSKDHSDFFSTNKYFLSLLTLLSLVSIIICVINWQNRFKKSPPSSTNDSMQFDLEINGYFKNSFPGVEREYPTLGDHGGQHGFVNNHPHINDFT